MKKVLKNILIMVLVLSCLAAAGCNSDSKDSSTSFQSSGIESTSSTEVSTAQSSSSAVSSSQKQAASKDSGTKAAASSEIQLTEKQKILQGLDSSMYSSALLNEGNMTRIANAMKKAQKGGTVTIGFIGGSITQGAGASGPDSRYANLVKQWWEDNFPKATIQFVNAGFGSSNAEMACYRLENDLLKYNPDFVVVDFAVNFYLDDNLPDTYQALIYRILKSKNAPGVLAILFSRTNSDLYNQGRVVRADNDEVNELSVAKSYGIPVISYDRAVWLKINARKLAWYEIGSDYIHPNDAGHLIAANLVGTYLNKVKAKLASIGTSAPSVSQPGNNAYLNVKCMNQNNASGVVLGSFSKDSAQNVLTMGWSYSAGGGTNPFKLNISGAKQVRLFIKTSSGTTGSLQTTFAGNSKTVALSQVNSTPSIASAFVLESAASGTLSIIPNLTSGDITIYGIFIQ